MVLTPNSSIELAKNIRELYSDAEELILSRLAHQLARGIDTETWVDRKYADLQDLNRQLDRLLADLADGVPGAVERVMRMAYNRGTAAAVADLNKAGVGAGATAAPPVPASVAAFVESTIGTLEQLPFRIRRWANDVYSQVASETAGQILTGTQTRRDASAAALKKYTARGVTGFKDRAGREWDLASYAEMTARTTTTQASLQGHTTKLQDLGQDLVIISDAPEECKLCRDWESQVLSISGQTRGRLKDGTVVRGTVREATAAGLFHANCRHRQGLYVPGITERLTDTADPEGDRLRQRQRAYERRVRQWKRRVIVDDEIHGKDSEAAKATRKKLRSAQADFKSFRDANDRKNLSYRTSLTAR